MRLLSVSVFQSAPGFWAGRNMRNAVFDRADFTVSIRSRLLGREKLSRPGFLLRSVMFQSAPGFWAGRNLEAA